MTPVPFPSSCFCRHSRRSTTFAISGNAMKIVHRVSFTPTDVKLEAFSSLSLRLEDHSNKFVKLFIFEIDESDPAWPEVEVLINQFGLSDFVGTKFTDEDSNSANFLKIDAGTKGYPLPEENSVSSFFLRTSASCDSLMGCQDYPG